MNIFLLFKFLISIFLTQQSSSSNLKSHKHFYCTDNHLQTINNSILLLISIGMQPSSYYQPRLSHLYSSSSLTSHKNYPSNSSLNQFQTLNSYGTSSPCSHPPNPYFHGIPTHLSLQSKKQTLKIIDNPIINDKKKTHLSKQAQSHFYIDTKPTHQPNTQNQQNLSPITNTFNKYRLSNTIYLKSLNRQPYRQNDIYTFNIQQEVVQTQNRSRNSFGLMKSLSENPLFSKEKISKLNTKVTQESQSHNKEQDFVQSQIYSRYVENMIEKYGYSLELKQQKQLKQTRENTSRYTESQKKREQSPLCKDFRLMFKLDEQLQQLNNNKSYLPESIKPTKRTYLQLNDEYKQKRFGSRQNQSKAKQNQSKAKQNQINAKQKQSKVNQNQSKAKQNQSKANQIQIKSKQNLSRHNPKRNNKVFEDNNDKRLNSKERNKQRENIIIKQYKQQNFLLQRQNYKIQKCIQDKINYERKLLDRLNIIMIKLQTFKSPSPSYHQTINQQSQQYQSFNKYSYLNNLSHSQSPYQQHHPHPSLINLHPFNTKTITKPNHRQCHDKENYFHTTLKYNQSIYNPSLPKLSSPVLNHNPITNTLTSIKKKPSTFDPILEYSLFKQHNSNPYLEDSRRKNTQSLLSLNKSRHNNTQSQVSCFDSKFVPRITNKQKLIELEKTFEEELNRYFECKNKIRKNGETQSQKAQVQGKNKKRMNNHCQREREKRQINSGFSKIESSLKLDKLMSKQKLTLMSQQIKQLRLIVSQEENSISNRQNGW